MAFPLVLKEYLVQGHPVQLFEPDNHVMMDSYRSGSITFPYWSKVWPAAEALAQFLINHPHYTVNKKVLELAAGLGLPAVVAARNAISVVASDYVEEALEAVWQSAKINKTQNLQVQMLNWYALPDSLCADVLLLSDVSYDAALFDIQEKVIKGFIEQGTVVIMSTPQRLIAKEAMMPLISFCIFQEEIMILHHNNEVPVTVMVLQKNGL